MHYVIIEEGTSGKANRKVTKMVGIPSPLFNIKYMGAESLHLSRSRYSNRAVNVQIIKFIHVFGNKCEFLMLFSTWHLA